MIYFDHNATSPLSPGARKAWLEASDRFIGNPSSPHRLGQRADAALAEAREKLAAHLGCDVLDIVWTSGATEAANTILQHCAKTLPADAAIWISPLEHPSILEPAKYLFGKRLQRIPVSKSGAVESAWLKREFRKRKPGLVVVMAANNETGVLQPWTEIAALCSDAQVPFFCDATQWLGKLPAAGLGRCDYVSGSAHKFGGPKGVGFFKTPSIGRFAPLLRGGRQEEGRRAGTENVPGILAMIAALNEREVAMKNGMRQIEKIRAAFEKCLLKILPGAEIVGANNARLWNTVCALMPPAHCRQQRWVVKLDKLGFAVSTGSACASGKEEPSHVLLAMGYSPAEAGRVLRFSSGWETQAPDWRQLTDALKRVHDEMKQ